MEEELIQTLKATLEPNASVILAAQKHLEQHLHNQPQVGVSLINIVHGGPAIPLPIRQAAAVNLSLWIKQRWSPFFSEFVGFTDSDGSTVALSLELKEPIRQALLSSVSLEEVKLRGPMIKALVNVASCDWPDEFPTLLPMIQQLLSAQVGIAEGLVAISGALSFLDDWFYNSMDETGLMSITRDILPDLERILSDTKIYPAPVRCRCISIFNQMLETLWMVKEQYPEASKTVAAEIIPRWLSSLEVMVAPGPSHQVDPQGGFGQAQGEEFALQAQAWTTISTATHFPAHIKSRLPTLLSTALSVLTVLQTPFHLIHISSLDTSISSDTTSDFYSTPSSLAGRIIDFVGIAMQNSFSKATTNSSTLSTLIPLLRSYSRITSEEQEEWQENVSSFVAAGEEDDANALNTSMRARCGDILSEIILVAEKDTLEALQQAVTSAHKEGSQRRQRGEEDWWKEEEASLALIGGVAEHIVEKLEDAKDLGQSAPFDVESIFASSVLPNINTSSPYFLYGRCFVFASQFASILPEDLAKNFLEAAVSALEREANEEGDAIVKLSAVRCIKNFHRHLSLAVLRPFSARILSRLGPLLDSSSEDTLVLIVETLQAVAMQDTVDETQAIPSNVYGDIVSEAIRAWAKEASDRVLQTTVEDLLEAFAAHKSPSTSLAVVQRAFNICAGLLSQEQSAQQDKYRSSVIVEGSLEFAGAVARGASSDILSQSGAVLPFLGPFFDGLAWSDDREVFKNGAVLLTSLISKMPDEILAWHDARGTSSLQHILTLISSMISPQDTYESGGLAVGDLLTIILRRRPEALSSALPQLCTALASRLATSASTSLTQSLILPLAYLMKDHLETIFGLLQTHSVSVDDATIPALQILLKRWCEFATSFQGFWNTRVSSLGLCAILKQAKQSGLDDIIVDGDLIPDDVNIIKTRSRAKLMPNRYTQVPVSAKILKILVNEYTQSVDGPPSQSKKNGKMTAEDDDFDQDDEDDDDEWNDDEDFVKKQKRDAFLADMMGEDLEGDLEDLFAQHDEEQYSDDFIYNMPFRSYLSSFFRELAQDSERASQLASHLTQREVSVLQSAIA